MANTTSNAKKQTALKNKVKKLQTELAKVNDLANALKVTVQKTDAHFYKIPKQRDTDDFGLGKFLLRINVTAGKDMVYIPTSIASGRKSTGFIYQVEGTAGATSTAKITCQGEGITTVTSGTLSYCKIPAGKTATFKIMAEVIGAEGKTYKIVMSRINYKLNPNDLRYKRYLTEIGTDILKFR